MSDEIKNGDMTPEEESPELNDEGEPRPPVDPKNKLYTFLSLLIFAVLYIGWYLIKENLYFSYALHADTFTPEERAAVISEIPQLAVPEEADLSFARLHKAFDGNSLYIAVSVPAELQEDEEFPESIIPFPVGDPERDIRLAVYNEADDVPDYFYGDRYVNIGDPRITCFVYAENDSCTAVFRIAEYSGDIARRIDCWEKIPIK